MESLNWKKAIIAGVAGTILFDIVGLIFTGQWWDIPGLLGQKTGLGFVYGIFSHYGNGVLLAILYTAIAPSSWGTLLGQAIYIYHCGDCCPRLALYVAIARSRGSRH